jgi:hypothetical protein
MMLIDMTNQLGSLLAGLDILLVIAATAIAASTWHRQRTSLASPSVSPKPRLAAVGSSHSAPAPTGNAPSDTSVSEAA